MGYGPLHCRTYYSFLSGCLSPEDVCSFVAAEGSACAGITDINGLYGLPVFIREAERAGIKPVVGAVIAPAGTPLFTAYTMSRRGFGRLCELISAVAALRECRGVDGTLDPVADLAEHGWEGLRIVSDDPAVLERLRQRQKRDVYAGLVYGRPFASLVRRARCLDIELLAYNDLVYLDAKDPPFLRLLRAMDKNTLVEEVPPCSLPGKERFAVGEAEMKRFFSAVPQAMINAHRLAEECCGSPFPKGYVFPRFRDMDEGEAYRHLKSLCNNGIHRRYGTPRRDVLERLEYELAIIRAKGFASYFLVVYDITSRFSRTCGRGSSASSIVSYLLGITHVDPLAHNLFFERFLNMGRKDPPDIDVDFPWDEREKALSYVFGAYPGRAAFVADHITFRHRSALRESARAFGLEEEEIGRLIRDYRLGKNDNIPGYLLDAADRLYGMPRHLGTHPGGVVITPGPITGYTHLHTSGTGFPVIAWEKDGAEDAGLVKIDLLGNRSLGVLRDTLKAVNAEREVPLIWEDFNPIGDTRTRQAVEKGDTLGVFYVESPATRLLLKKMGRGDYEHLVAASSIIWPAANRFIGEYVRRLKGGAYRPLHPLVADTLAETYGIMVYQEDVARVAIAGAGFSPREADSLRKVLSRKDRSRRLPFWRERFLSGAEKRGMDRQSALELWEGILSFDGYSFCKAHSASYALVSYRLAWLKVRYPLEFFAEVINNGGGFYGRQVYVNAVRRMGFPVIGPDINKSELRYTVEDGRLRVGLSQLRDISRECLLRLLRRREEGGPFSDIEDFARRVAADFADIRVLIRSGCFDGIAGGKTRPELFWVYYHRERNASFFLPPPPPALGDYPPAVRLADEAKTLSLIISRHPLDIFSRRIRNLEHRQALRIIDSRLLPNSAGREVCLAGTLVAEKETRTKDRRAMCFVSFEDSFSIFETVFFPEIYRELCEILEGGTAFIIRGIAENDGGAVQIRVRDLIPLNRRNGLLQKEGVSASRSTVFQ